MSVLLAFARSALAQAGRLARSDPKYTRPKAPNTPKTWKRDKLGRIAKGSRKAFNAAMNAKYDKPNGRMTWAQIVETASHQAEHGTDLVDDLEAENADESY